MLALLLVAFLLIPVAELAVIVAATHRIGLLATLALLVAFSAGGSYLARREGMEVWRRFRAALGRGEIPSQEVVDGFLVLLAAAMLLTPGFLTDAAGLLLLVPPTRKAVKTALRAALRRHLEGRRRRATGPRRARVVSINTSGPPNPDPGGGEGPAPPPIGGGKG